MNAFHHASVATSLMVALVSVLGSCSHAPTAPFQAAGALPDDWAILAALPKEAKTIKTEIGAITMGLLPVGRGGKGKSESAADLPSVEEEWPGVSIMGGKGQTLPAKVDLRDYFSPVRNQGSLGSCSAFAATGLMEAMLNMEGRKSSGTKVKHLSPLFFYYAERKILEETGQIPHAMKKDTGAFLSTAADTAVKFGAPLESDVPYKDGRPALAYDASPEDFQAAEQFRSKRKAKISTLQGLKSALAHNKPFVFPIALYQSFMTHTVSRSGEMPMPMRGEEVVGGHAVAAVGYDDAKQAFLVRNSWGNDWGQAGYFWMPFAYFKTTYVGSYYYGDCWTLE